MLLFENVNEVIDVGMVAMMMYAELSQHGRVFTRLIHMIHDGHRVRRSLAFCNEKYIGSITSVHIVRNVVICMVCAEVCLVDLAFCLMKFSAGPYVW